MRWEDALNYQLDLTRFWATDLGLRYGEKFGNALLEKAPLDIRTGEPIEDLRHRPEMLSSWERDLAQTERSKLEAADAVFVSEDVQALIDAAAESFQPEPLIREDLLTPTGFVLFERPFMALDRWRKNVSYRAISWGPITDSSKPPAVAGTPASEWDGLHMVWYSHVDDKDDVGWDESERARAVHRLIVCHMNLWWFDRTSFADVPGGGADQYKVFQILSRLAAQTITAVEDRAPSRHARRRAAREGRPDLPVTVIHLRHTRGGGGGNGHPANYSHRFFVAGHWRNQWYPSIQRRRQIWISEYIKGDESLPLEIKKHRVFDFIR